MFITDRLRLRGFELSDARNVFDFRNNPSIQPTMSNEYVVPRGPKFMEKIAAKAEEAVMYLMIETKGKDSDSEGHSDGGNRGDELDVPEFVGTTSITMTHPKNRDGIFTIMLSPKFWGQGYGEEVTRWVVDYHGSGFVEEGRKRKVNWADGHWEDNVLMGILEEEWDLEAHRAIAR
ncbi:acyl-CoA N-acyltransferase [Rhodocollybia butyracea]|uniref:Acyl-CoA N-acyltransferase n=1 Tax=Rhodocollybia butyracea TaxID=206335 RepID=A0A9P5PFM4_9AGAR|nr:acyl-CoA N-acyltransferase [Rhodocollybia butyracea]